MYTSVMLVALTSSVVASNAHAPTWQSSYAEARTVGQSEKKPLAVFIGNGSAGYGKVCRDGKLSADVEKCLADHYVCVYVDASTPEGRKLAQDFGITQGTGLVLSDRTGQLQAFFHDGTLTDADMVRNMTRFADPNVAVKTTATVYTSQTSMYPPEGGLPGYPPTGGFQGYPYGGQPGMWYGGSSCPGGNCGGGRRR
jgi:hypothetical protein